MKRMQRVRTRILGWRNFWWIWGGDSKHTPLSKASIKTMLTNRAYIGFIKHHDEWFDGSFEPIISPQLFEAVQKMLKKRERPCKVKNGHDFPFVGLFRCGGCESMITAQHTHGNGGTYRYYRCTKKKGVCGQKYLREDILVSQLKERLQSISLCDRYTDWMLEEIGAWEKEEQTSSHSDVQNLSLKIKESETRMEKLVSTYLDGDIPKDIYLKKKDVFMRSTLSLKEKKKDFEQRGNSWVEPLREWVLDTKQATFLTSSDNFKEIASFVKKVGTNHVVRDKTARFSVPTPSHYIAKRKVHFSFPSSCAPTAHYSSSPTSDEVRFCAQDWS
ncbi:recombinase family protein [Candidatus Pacebacteria bacterium]|nr:recombinase family protein [Candidatus Paceibacterota bacterium]